jgi:hypothetical protein
MACPYYRRKFVEYCLVRPVGITLPAIAREAICSTKKHEDCMIFRYAHLVSLAGRKTLQDISLMGKTPRNKSQDLVERLS